jgi:protein O-mannosyl-transferase
LRFESTFCDLRRHFARGSKDIFIRTLFQERPSCVNKDLMQRFAPIVLLLISFAVYAPALTAPYMWDDLSLIENNPTLDDHGNISRYFTSDLGLYNQHPRLMGFYRPLQALSFHIEVAVFGRNAPWQRAVNILLHGLAAIALYLIALSLLKSKTGAFFAGLLFAAHPLCSEQVCLVANRGGVATGALTLWTLALITRATGVGGKLKNTPLIAAAFLYVAALLFKPEPLTLFVPVAAWLLLARPNRNGERKPWIATAGMIAGLAAAYALWRWGFLGISHGHKSVNVDLLTRLLALPRLTLDALRLSLLPVGLRAIRSADYEALSALPGFFASTLIWLILLVLAWRRRREHPVFAFAAVFFATAIAPYSGLVALVRPVAEHYYYLPAAATCLALAGLGEVISRKRLARCLLATLVVLFACATILRAFVWQNEERLWLDNALKEPANSQVLNNLGTVCAQRNDYDSAWLFFTQAASANPSNIKARLNRANVGIETGRHSEIIGDITDALLVDPCNRKALILLGRLVASKDQDAWAITDFKQRMERNPCAALGYVGAAMEYEKRGRKKRAAGYYRKFLEAAPGHPLAGSVRQSLAGIEKH